MPAIADPTDPTIDRWLRSLEPRQELVVRYAMRGRFDAAKSSARFNARVDELFAAIKPGENELAAIMRHAREIGAQIEQHVGEQHPNLKRRRAR